jgi:hypothetical protein
MHKFGLTLVMLIMLSSGYAQTCEQKAPPEDVNKMSALIGEWIGEFTDSETTHTISMKFYIENEELKAHVTNRSILTGSETADVSLCSTNKFHFFGSRINGEFFTYNARLVNGNLIGNYKIGKNCSKENRTSFNMTKTRN